MSKPSREQATGLPDKYERLEEIQEMKKNKSEKIKCPLCGTAIKHENYKEAHLWVCPDCPFVGFEYYTDKDAKKIRERLNK